MESVRRRWRWVVVDDIYGDDRESKNDATPDSGGASRKNLSNRM